MLPTAFNERLIDNFFNDSFGMMHGFGGHHNMFGKHGKNLMTADVRELENAYELDIDLPGFKKDEIGIELEDGCLTISAARGQSREEEDKKGQYIRRERCMGECRRTFYVGRQLEPKDVNARFEDGILRLSFPKCSGEEKQKESRIAIQ